MRHKNLREREMFHRYCLYEHSSSEYSLLIGLQFWLIQFLVSDWLKRNQVRLLAAINYFLGMPRPKPMLFFIRIVLSITNRRVNKNNLFSVSPFDLNFYL